MPNNGWKSVVLWILLTVLLGAVGSGLWEIALRPGGYWFWHAVLTAATFGSKFLKDQVYLEAAKGNHEAIANHSLMIVSWICAAVFGSYFGFAMNWLRKLRSTEKTPWLLRNPRFIRPFLQSTIVFFLFLACMHFVQDLKVKTANELYTYFQQSLDICRPYINEHQEQILKSRFAALRTRDEYITIANELQQVADANHVMLPDFKPW
jgi:hypothetical protein